MNGQYVIFFIPEVGMYSFYDRYDRPPMRKILEDDIIARCDTFTNANMVVDSLNSEGLI